MDENIIGPVLPAGFKKISPENTPSPKATTPEPETQAEPTSEYYGPKLPPHLLNQRETNPIIPPPRANEESSEEEAEVYGPMPAGSSGSSEAQNALERRALQIKLGYSRTDDDDATVREEWMVQLPEVGKNLGLGSRQFRKNPTADFSDRSSWTDTPSTKEKKKAPVDSFKEDEIRERDKEQEKIAEKYKKKRKKDKSLYDMHQDKMKKKKKETEGEVPTRIPFSRETDLKVNQFDDAQKKAILKKAQHLDDRFSQGKAKFL